MSFSSKKLDFFFELVEVHKKASTCLKHQTGCIIVRDDGSIASSGYNGVSAGKQHCCDRWRNMMYELLGPEADEEKYIASADFRKDHREWSKSHEIHAERNALYFATRNGVMVKDCTLFTFLSPCLQCAISSHLLGIKQVIYRKKYNEEGIAYLEENGVKVMAYKPLSSVKK